MRTVKDMALESYKFGSNTEDTYYLLIDLVHNPDGLDINRLTNADPRRFDSVLTEMGCILMLSGDEMQELVRRGDIDEHNKLESLFYLARTEGLI
jgi:predicted AAA+ superfamily ATPase